MKIKEYLDSTYLKTAEQAGISDSDTLEKVRALVLEAIENGFYAVMIRPNYVRVVHEMLLKASSKVKLGTVIDFPEGTTSLDAKLKEAQRAIADGADELDFVINYSAFLKGDLEKVREEVLSCTTIAIREGKVVKWIIETAALKDEQIVQITKLITDVVVAEIGEEKASKVFVKSSTGFFPTPEGVPNGATEHVIKLMLENASPLLVKASGGIRTKEEAEKMIDLGVKRIGASSALEISKGYKTNTDY